MSEEKKQVMCLGPDCTKMIKESTYIRLCSSCKEKINNLDGYYCLTTTKSDKSGFIPLKEYT